MNKPKLAIHGDDFNELMYFSDYFWDDLRSDYGSVDTENEDPSNPVLFVSEEYLYKRAHDLIDSVIHTIVYNVKQRAENSMEQAA